jgi:polyphenol oxidase
VTAGPIDAPPTAPAPGGANAAAYAEIDDFSEFGIRALVTTRAAGSLSVATDESVGAVMTRWRALRTELGAHGPAGRFATAAQVHGARVLTHHAGWAGWLRADDADGHFSRERGTGLGVSVADCVPAMLAHPSGATALVHAGWRGTAALILRAAVDLFQAHGLSSGDLRLHLGPAICGGCYEVGPDVYGQLTGRAVAAPATVDLRAILADQARAAGVRIIAVSRWCTRCDNAVFYSHRAGDSGRQVAALMATP